MHPGWQLHQDGGFSFRLSQVQTAGKVLLSEQSRTMFLIAQQMFIPVALIKSAYRRGWRGMVTVWVMAQPAASGACTLHGCARVFWKVAGPIRSDGVSVLLPQHLIAWLRLYLQSPNPEACSTEEIILPSCLLCRTPFVLYPGLYAEELLATEDSVPSLSLSLQLPSAGARRKPLMKSITGLLGGLWLALRCLHF